jgi:hypothetical protein
MNATETTIKSMTYQSYQDIFNQTTNPPYEESLMDYMKLNQSRHDRWMKKGELLSETTEHLAAISEPQTWVLISEPWCGDAAHITPFIFKMAKMNPAIRLEVQLRDSESEIENYLTNGNKAIPLLIVRNQANEDLFTWGPRPKDAQASFMKTGAKGMEMEQRKIELQNWYNNDKGAKIQNEIIALLKQFS